MAKNSFVIYCSWEEQLGFLTMEERGELFSALFAYEKRGEVYTGENKLLQMAFSLMKIAMDENREKWEERSRRNRENGAKGGRPPNHPPSGSGYIEKNKQSELPMASEKDTFVHGRKDVSELDTEFAAIPASANERVRLDWARIQRYMKELKATEEGGEAYEPAGRAGAASHASV